MYSHKYSCFLDSHVFRYGLASEIQVDVCWEFLGELLLLWWVREDAAPSSASPHLECKLNTWGFSSPFWSCRNGQENCRNCWTSVNQSWQYQTFYYVIKNNSCFLKPLLFLFVWHWQQNSFLININDVTSNRNRKSGRELIWEEGTDHFELKLQHASTYCRRWYNIVVITESSCLSLDPGSVSG